VSTTISLAATTQGDKVMRYDSAATARPFGVLQSLALPVVSSHRQGLLLDWRVNG
jgi:hypothetical protein